MQVETKLFFDFTKYLPPESINRTALIVLEDGTTVNELIQKLGLPPDIPKLIVINGISANSDTILKNNDSVAIFPPMAGG